MLASTLTVMLAATYPLVGILLPGAILILSFLLTWMLYRRFSRRH